MPGISEGFHTKMSLLSRRKSTSVLSYLEESVVPMRTSLEPSVDSNDLVDFLASGASLVTSSLRVASSLEATIAVACPQL